MSTYLNYFFCCILNFKPHTTTRNGRGGIDVFNPDYEKNPQFLNASCYDDVVKPGEMIYYPKLYWHATQTLSSPTVSLSSLLVNRNSWRDVVEKLMFDDCAGYSSSSTTSTTKTMEVEVNHDPSNQNDENNDIDNQGNVTRKKANFPQEMCERMERCYKLFEEKFK
jgi:hypothetical protein